MVLTTKAAYYVLQSVLLTRLVTDDGGGATALPSELRQYPRVGTGTSDALTRRATGEVFKQVILAGTALAMFLAATPVLADSGSAYLVKDIYPGDSADPWLLTGFGNLVYFQADDGIHGRELWRSDGSKAGTLLVSDGLAGSKSSDPEPLGGAGSYFYFDTKDSVHGRELWRTNADGTGSTMVKDLTPGKDSSHFESGIALGQQVPVRCRRLALHDRRHQDAARRASRLGAFTS